MSLFVEQYLIKFIQKDEICDKLASSSQELMRLLFKKNIIILIKSIILNLFVLFNYLIIKRFNCILNVHGKCNFL